MKRFQGTESGYFVAVFKASADIEVLPDILVYRFEDAQLPLEWLKEQVGGFIEIVRPDYGRDAYLCCNDNSIIDGLPFNFYASLIYSNGRFSVCGDCVLGCDFDTIPFFVPDMYAAPAWWLRDYLVSLGFLSRAYLVEE